MVYWTEIFIQVPTQTDFVLYQGPLVPTRSIIFTCAIFRPSFQPKRNLATGFYGGTPAWSDVPIQNNNSTLHTCPLSPLSDNTKDVSLHIPTYVRRKYSGNWKQVDPIPLRQNVMYCLEVTGTQLLVSDFPSGMSRNLGLYWKLMLQVRGS